MASTRQPNQARQEQKRHDDHEHKNDLNVWNGAALLVADCMGTGVSTVPYHTYGRIYYNFTSYS